MERQDVRYRGRVVGHVDDQGVFWRRVGPSHILERPRAIALHVEVLRELEALGCKTVAFEMTNHDFPTVMTGPFSLFADRGIDVDRGWGPQRAVLLSDLARMSEWSQLRSMLWGT